MATLTKTFTQKSGAKNAQKVGARKVKRTVTKSTGKPKQKVKVDPLRRISGMSLYSGESKIEKLGKKQVLISRDTYPDKYGNPVYRASVLDADGKTGKSYRSNGGPLHAVKDALKNN